MKRFLLLSIVALGTAAAASAAESVPGPTMPIMNPVRSFQIFGRLDAWQPVDRDSLIVWVTPSRPYLVDLKYGSPDLRFSDVVGVTSTVGRVHAKADSVVIRGIKYPIETIYELDPIQARNWNDFGVAGDA
jgi:hypothetical protein